MVRRILEIPEGRWLIALAIIALAVRIPWAIAMADRTPLFDEAAYIAHAEQLCAGQGYVNLEGDPSNFWPVGYPALLAAAYCTFGVGIGVGVGLQIFILMLTCLAVSRIGDRNFGPGIGRTAALLLALYPNYIFYSTLMLTEPLATLLLVSLSALLVRASDGGTLSIRKVVGAGMLAGLLALVRPSFLLLPALLPLWAVLQRIPWRRTILLTVLFTTASVATMSPWLIRNHEAFGRFEIASNGGFVFWGGNHPDALGGVNRPPAVRTDLSPGTDAYDGSLGYRLGLESIASDIPASIRRSVQKLTYFLAIETDGAMWNYKGLEGAGRGVVPVLVASLAYLGAMMTGIFALLHGLRNRSFGCWFLLLSAYSIAIAMLFEGDPRYHFPLLPFLLIYSALAVHKDIPGMVKQFRYGGLSNAGRRVIVAWSAAMFVFLLLVVSNLWLKMLEGRM